MSKEAPQPEFYFGEERYDVVLGKRFKPFEDATNFYQTLEGKTSFSIPEDYDHKIYLRKWISLNGINGFADIIDEKPTSFIDQMVLNAMGIRFFSEHPMGEMQIPTVFLEGKKWVNADGNPVILRFSFLPKTQGDYSRLLATYGEVELGQEEYFLTFNFNQKAVKKGMSILESGQQLLIVEKNLFNNKPLQELQNEEKNLERGEDDSEENYEANDKKVSQKVTNPEEDPGRVCFITLPKDLAKLKGIAITFRFGFGNNETTTDPREPSSLPIPLLV